MIESLFRFALGALITLVVSSVGADQLHAQPDLSTSGTVQLFQSEQKLTTQAPTMPQQTSQSPSREETIEFLLRRAAAITFKRTYVRHFTFEYSGGRTLQCTGFIEPRDWTRPVIRIGTFTVEVRWQAWVAIEHNCAQNRDEVREREFDLREVSFELGAYREEVLAVARRSRVNEESGEARTIVVRCHDYDCIKSGGSAIETRRRSDVLLPPIENLQERERILRALQYLTSFAKPRKEPF